MKRLNRYMLARFFGPFFMTFFICIFVLLMQFLWRYLEEIVGKGLEPTVIAELMLYASSNLVPLALPLSMLIASIMTFGNLGEDNELLAMKAAGISLFRIFKPLIIVSVLLCGFAFFFSNKVLPITNKKFGALLFSVKRQRPEIAIKEGAFSNDIDGYSIKVAEKTEKGTLIDLMIYNHTAKDGNKEVTIADSAYMKISEDKVHMILTLFNGETYKDVKPKPSERRKKKFPFEYRTFKQQQVVIQLEGMNFDQKDESIFKDNYKATPIDRLEILADSLSNHADQRAIKHAIKYRYLTPMNSRIAVMTRPDSLRGLVPELNHTKTLNLDSVFTAQGYEKRKKIVEEALRDARSNERSIMSADNEVRSIRKYVNKHWLEWHRKFTLSIAVIIFFFLGAPLGAIIRKGGMGLPLVISIVLFIMYYVIGMIVEKAAREGAIPAWEAMWFSSAIFLPASLYLTHMAANDSTFLNFSAITSFFSKFIPEKWKKKVEDQRDSRFDEELGDLDELKKGE